MNYIFDLDNTLIYSDLANNFSYKEAVRNILNEDLNITAGRITRNDLKTMFPNLTTLQMSNIVHEKEKKYKTYFNMTILNTALVMILKYLSENNKRTILLTYSGKNRAEQLLKYHGIDNLFAEKYYKEDYGKNTKYKFATDVLAINSHNLVLFENETESLNDAVNNGIIKNNIIKIV